MIWNESDAPPPSPCASAPVKIATTLYDACSSELGAAVLARRDERSTKYQILTVLHQLRRTTRRWSRMPRGGRRSHARAAPTAHALDHQGRSGGGDGGGGACDAAGLSQRAVLSAWWQVDRFATLVEARCLVWF